MSLNRTALYPLHESAGAKMVPFAGYEMPLQYPTGIVWEHNHCRQSAGLFDVSHMGQVSISGTAAASDLEALMPVDLQALQVGQHRYALLTNSEGGVIDDLIITRRGADDFMLVLNAACKLSDIEYLRQCLPNLCIRYDSHLCLLALQGPCAVDVLAAEIEGIQDLVFMQGREGTIGDVPCYVARCGYTGEDGFEITVADQHACLVAQRLLAHHTVEWVGLGARDSLRLEAGLCLHGQDLTADTTPIEAGLGWSISRVRRAGGTREGGYVGSEKILQQQRDGVDRRRVGFMIEEKAPVRHGAVIIDPDGKQVGEVTSGGFGPSKNTPVAMGYVATAWSNEGTRLHAVVRGKPRAIRVTAMPWVVHRYVRN